MGAIFAMAKNREKRIFLFIYFFQQFKSPGSTLSSKVNGSVHRQTLETDRQTHDTTNPGHDKPWTIYCFKTFTHSPGFFRTTAPDFSSLPQVTGT
jgi:hypothetical protein